MLDILSALSAKPAVPEKLSSTQLSAAPDEVAPQDRNVRQNSADNEEGDSAASRDETFEAAMTVAKKDTPKSKTTEISGNAGLSEQGDASVEKGFPAHKAMGKVALDSVKGVTQAVAQETPVVLDAKVAANETILKSFSGKAGREFSIVKTGDGSLESRWAHENVTMLAQSGGSIKTQAMSTEKTLSTVPDFTTQLTLESEEIKSNAPVIKGEVDKLLPDAQVSKAPMPIKTMLAGNVEILSAAKPFLFADNELTFSPLPANLQTSSVPQPAIAFNTMAAVNNAAATSAAAQIAAAIRTDRISNTVEVRLDPPDLGRVRIDFTMETADAVKAVLTAERSDTLDHLRRNMSLLADELKSAGFTTIDLEFSDQGASDFKKTAAHFDMNGDGESVSSNMSKNVVYLSLRDDAQLNMLA